MIEVSRRALCQALGIGIAGAPAFLRSATVLAADMDKVTIGGRPTFRHGTRSNARFPTPSRSTSWCSTSRSIRRRTSN